jgi:saccharopine dehydrogenase-like NADP-dependent oxidoreductase
MKKQPNIIVAGAGGVGQAVALILAEFSEDSPKVFLGGRNFDKTSKIARWIEMGTTGACPIVPFTLPEDGINEESREVLAQSDIILDCLPGSEAPRMARWAREYDLHYANLTEYVKETNEIIDIAKGSDKGFLLQTGLAPGFINVLANGLFKGFCKRYHVHKVDYIGMKVGALTRHATPPHFYGFTWSPVGVATEYIKDAICIRDFKKTTAPSLSEREKIYLDGLFYEADLTSGGAADLPDAFQAKTRKLDYKTIRFPGHYDWVADQLKAFKGKTNVVDLLQDRMEDIIPRVEEDQVVIYASVEGKDSHGVMQRVDRTYHIRPQKVGKRRLRAIQTTTAAPIVEAAHMLLKGRHKGIIFQSMIDPDEFLDGKFVSAFYGRWNSSGQ